MDLKDKIYSELSKRRSEYISGQTLAKLFGVSRNSVWKAVNELKKDGCNITSVTNKGYLLLSGNGIISKTKIEEILGNDVTVKIFDVIDSTNSEAKRILSCGFSGKAIIVADEQTSGRGRLGRTFYSPKSTGVYFSIIITPDSSLSDASLVTTAASVAAMRAIEKTTGKRVMIKWVNDLYLGEKKICGILTEAVTDLENGKLSGLVVGVGINISTDDFPEDIKERAASLGVIDADRSLIAAETAKEFFDITNDLSNRKFLNEYRERSYVLGKDIYYIKNGEKHDGKAVGIDDDGGLIVEKENGENTILRGGEITVRVK